MGILQLPLQLTGQVGVIPNSRPMCTTDNLATITAAGYLNQYNLQSYPVGTNDVIEMFYSYNIQTQVGTYGIFTVSVAVGTGIITLTQWTNPNDVTLPTVAGDFAQFSNTTGTLEDTGISPSDATKTKVAMVGSSVAIGNIAKFVDIVGTVDDTAGTAVNLGNISAGASGTAGTVSSFPATAANGSLVLAATNAGGAFITTISNGTMGQSTVYSLADIGASTGGIPVATTAFRMKSVAGAAAAGGAAAQSFTDTFCTSGSNVVGNWNTQANAVSVLKIVPGNGSFVVTSSGDAGVGTFNYIITK